MALSVVSWVALAAIAAALGVAWSRRFLALGALALANVVVHGLTVFGPTRACTVGDATGTISTIHCELALHGDALAAGEPLAFLQLFTSMFVHADFYHIFGNLIVLLAFSLPFEERIGARPFLLIYLASGLVGALFQLGTAWGEATLLMGASGAVFGLIGAFAGAFPRLVVPLPLPLVFIMIWVRTQVWKAAAAFAAVQVLFQFLSGTLGIDDRTAYMAHLGGLAAGLVLAAIYVRRKGVTADGRVVGAPARRREPVSLAGLQPFARDQGSRRALAEMERSRDEPEVFAAWQERFLQSATCPQCGAEVRPEKPMDLVCGNGHRFDLRQPPAAAGGAPAAGGPAA